MTYFQCLFVYKLTVAYLPQIDCMYLSTLSMTLNRGVRCGVSKRVEDYHKLNQGWLPAVPGRVEHGGLYRYFKESMATPCHTPMTIDKLSNYMVQK
jgi:hypothetical protein